AGVGGGTGWRGYSCGVVVRDEGGRQIEAAGDEGPGQVAAVEGEAVGEHESIAGGRLTCDLAEVDLADLAIDEPGGGGGVAGEVEGLIGDGEGEVLELLIGDGIAGDPGAGRWGGEGEGAGAGVAARGERHVVGDGAGVKRGCGEERDGKGDARQGHEGELRSIYRRVQDIGECRQRFEGCCVLCRDSGGRRWKNQGRLNILNRKGHLHFEKTRGGSTAAAVREA